MRGAGDKRKNDLRHGASGAPRVMVVDGSKLGRRLIGDVLHKELPNVEVVGCSGLEQARAALDDAPVDLVTTALVLPDGDGMQLAHAVRESAASSDERRVGKEWVSPCSPRESAHHYKK